MVYNLQQIYVYYTIKHCKLITNSQIYTHHNCDAQNTP